MNTKTELDHTFEYKDSKRNLFREILIVIAIAVVIAVALLGLIIVFADHILKNG